jgi:hypothetical protein
MEAVWLSVIVPSHNGQRWLSTALQSIADQKERGIEVIVIDSSTENTSLAIAESFSTQFAIQALRRPDLLPWTAKTNFGVEQAKGSWICMLHQDDFWLPNRSTESKVQLGASWVSSMPMTLSPVTRYRWKLGPDEATNPSTATQASAAIHLGLAGRSAVT